MEIVGYLIFTIIVMAILGKSKEWEYEAKLMVDGEYKIVGEVEFEKFKKKAPIGELEFYEKDLQLSGQYEIEINGDRVVSFRWDSTNSDLILDFPTMASHISRKSKSKRIQKTGNKFKFQMLDDFKVKRDDSVQVNLPSGEILKGVFVRD